MATAVRKTIEDAGEPRHWKHRFTVEEYHQMGEAGILGPDVRTELIEGEIIHLPPIGSKHAGAVIGLTELLVITFAGKALVSTQNPFQILPDSEPQPDFLLLRPRLDTYRSSHPGPDAIFLLIEVADSSLSYDRSTKLALYAKAGVREVWIVDLRGERIEIYRNPARTGYRDTHVAVRGEDIAPSAFPRCKLPVAKILG